MRRPSRVCAHCQAGMRSVSRRYSDRSTMVTWVRAAPLRRTVPGSVRHGATVNGNPAFIASSEITPSAWLARWPTR